MILVVFETISPVCLYFGFSLVLKNDVRDFIVAFALQTRGNQIKSKNIFPGCGCVVCVCIAVSLEFKSLSSLAISATKCGKSL